MKSFSIKDGSLSITLMLISVWSILSFTSCEKGETNETNDNFYVKYVIKGNGAYGRFSNWTATTPQGMYTNSGTQVSGWSQTYGPLTRGFKCEVRIGNSIGASPTIEILVSKNNEPFALKVTNTGNSATYVIN
ncbi:MAG: hypothetical protein EOP51_35235 [Sphingobacteriales bacterium]|nr:MAG: hypothetical protein EOP51_35235 [Sphingobacteriales bacterium]